ncbi:mucin-2 [Sitodiplosis mosellana]|uniref:mucin-2 n=1 Tax=Sitodiplosis mosellana TaxID=263140 RepID=UPI0024442BCC|nr:mucin-2 [Sitodiplosis mosellana]
MGEYFRLSIVLPIIVGLFMGHCLAQNPLLAGAIGTPTGRSINSGAFVQTNFEQNEKNHQKPLITTTGFTFNSKNSVTTQANFETTKPNFETTIPFVIPSYASGILEKIPTVPSPKLTTPSELLQPPIEQANGAVTQPSGWAVFRGIPTTALNSFDAETTTLSPVTQQRFGASPVTPRSNFNANARGTTTNQPKRSVFTQIATIAQAPIQFGTKVTTPVQTSTTTLKSTTAFISNFEKVTTVPAFGFDSARDEVLGNQKPGYAIKADGSIDSQALPPEFRNQFRNPFTTTQFTRAIPSSKLKSFEKPTTISTASTNFTNNAWLQQTTPFAQIPKQNPKPFEPSVTNPFLSHTTPVQVATTTNFLFDTTTQPIGQKVIGGGVRDRLPITTTLAPRDQFTHGPKSTQFNTFQPTAAKKSTQFNTSKPTSGPQPTQFNTFQPTNAPKSTQFNTFPPTTTFSPFTTTFNKFAQKSSSPVTQSTTFNGFNNNKIGVTQTTTTKQPVINRLPNAPSGLVIQVPEVNVLPPFRDGESTKFPAAFQTTKTQTTAKTLTTLPLTQAPTTTTTRAPVRVTTFPPTLPPTTNAFVTRQNQPSPVVNKLNQELLPPVDMATSSVTVHKSPAISLPSDDLLPPVTTVNTKPSTDKPTKESKPSEFLPQLDLNPFTAPFSGSAAAAPSTTATATATATTTRRPAPNAAQSSLADSPFDYKKPAKAFVIQANVQGGAQQQRPQQQQSQSNINTKYTGSFGAPPGILTPYDNQQN